MTVLAADIGGTSIKLGLVDDDHVLERTVLRVEDRARLAPLLPEISRAWKDLMVSSGVKDDSVSSISMAVPGMVDVVRRQVVSINEKFLDAPSLDLRRWAREDFGLELMLDNDARAALIGEWRAGAGRHVHDLVMLTLGTGIGVATVIDGRLVRGSHGQAGILGGHLTVNVQGRKCTCGNIGCAEAEASTDQLPHLIREVAEQCDLTGALLDEESPNYFRVFQQAEQADPLARIVRDRSLRIWSACIVSLIHAYGSRRVVIGGGIALGSPHLIRSMQDYVDRHAWTPWGRVELHLAQLGDDAALIGCGCLARNI